MLGCVVRAIGQRDQSLWIDTRAPRPSAAAVSGHEGILESMTEEASTPDAAAQPAAAAEEPEEAPPGQYWLRVYGYPIQIGEDLVRYGDCFDPTIGPLGEDPEDLIKVGDVIVYYAD